MGATYFGEVCSLHPECNGERGIRHRRCIACESIAVKAYMKKWRDANREKVREDARIRMKEWRKNNPNRVKEMNAMPERVAYRSSKRATSNKARVAWADEFIIREIYELAALRTKMTGIRWVVDHIVPFNSDKVCGLHCEANMQIITFSKNSGKGNRHWPDM